MNTNWIALRSIPSGGKTLVLDDPALWQTLLKEFGLVCRVIDPLRAEIAVLPQDEGVLFRGRLTGTVVLPCDRCADDSIVSLQHRFDSFEPYPADIPPVERGGKAAARDVPVREKDPDELDAADEEVIRKAPHGGVEINPAALAWQEFSLVLPIKPLCGEGCKGLCPVCGNNRNSSPCACSQDRGDPRLAALRELVVAAAEKK